MTNATYRVESTYPMMGPLLPLAGTRFHHLYDRALAIVLAAKSMTKPIGHEIRVVHVPTENVIFRKTAINLTPCSDDC